MEYILEMKDIHKSFGPVKVLEGIDFSLEQGEVRALLGANGAGKSTLVRCLNFLERPTSGTVLIEGREDYFFKRHIQFYSF